MADERWIGDLKSAKGVPIGILLDIDWGSDVAKKLLAASKRMNRWDILLRTIGRKYVSSVKRNFDEMRGPEGAWAPLKRPRPKGHNPLGMILQDSYELIKSVGYLPPDPIDHIRIGYGKFYGRFHQMGFTSRGGRWIKPRRFLWVREADQPGPEILKHVQVSFEEGGSEK